MIIFDAIMDLEDHIQENGFCGKQGDVDDAPKERAIEDSRDEVTEMLESDQPRLVNHDVLAPPGKLGIVFRGSASGPKITRLHPDSVVAGKISVGDIILAVDDVDTRSFNAKQLLLCLQKKTKKERVLSVQHLESAEEAEKMARLSSF